ncbi:uncharacterized protein DC041_0003455 [Schistosoma bovis]|uniref:Uncharacterized protein n=1 Tax=Schistosoma bovis TaxID=6184 RepID=A0A430PX14_SCHBO|nr:uncharacterized protein DC041_0003455 [Schistosoma bovis]
MDTDIVSFLFPFLIKNTSSPSYCFILFPCEKTKQPTQHKQTIHSCLLIESSSMNDITKLKTSNLNHQQFKQLLIDNTVKYTELNNNNQSSISFLIDKLNIEQSSEQAYIYQSIYSRFPITIKNISSYHQNNNNNNKLITNKINNPMIMKELFNKFAKHELILNREPTYSFYIPIQLSTTELNIQRYSKTLPRYNNKYDMIIHVNDLHNSLDNNNNNNVQYDMNMKQSIRHRMCTSLPRTKHALLYYSQPISPRKFQILP